MLNRDDVSLKIKIRKYAIFEQIFLILLVTLLIGLLTFTSIWQKKILNSAINSYTEEEAKSLARLLIYDLAYNPKLQKISHLEEQLSLLSKEVDLPSSQIPLGIKSLIKRYIEYTDPEIVSIATKNGYTLTEQNLRKIKKVIYKEELDKESLELSQDLSARVTFSDHLRGVTIKTKWGLTQIGAKEEPILLGSRKDLIQITFPLFLEMRRYGSVEILMDRGSLKGAQNRMVSTLIKIQLLIFSFLLTLLSISFYLWHKFFKKIENEIVIPITKLALKMEEWEKESLKEPSRKDEIKRLYQAFNDLLIRFEKQKEQILKAEKLGLMERVGAGLSHELNNALNPIKLRLDSILLEGENPSIEDIKVIKEHLESAEKIIKDLNSIKSYGRIANREVLKPSDWMEIVKRLFEPQVTNKMEVSYIYNPDYPLLYINKETIIEIALNLILNAKDAISEEEDQKIEFSFLEENSYAIIRVKDNGKGFPNEYLSNPFEPFFTTKPSGMGLGLFLVENYVRKIGGTIELKNLEKGALVEIKFKIYKEEDG